MHSTPGSGASCPICQRREPLDIVANLNVSKIHVVELHDLAEETAVAFMQDA